MTRRSKCGAAAAAFFLIAVSAFAILKPGDKLLPFSLKDTAGTEYTLKVENGRLTLITSDNASGTLRTVVSHPAAVLIDFWATWCVPCREGMPYMEQLFQKYKPADGQEAGGLRLFGIALDDKGSSKKVKLMYERSKVTYPMLFEPTTGNASDGLFHAPQDMKSPYDAIAIPVVYIIDAKGAVVFANQGFKKEHAAVYDEVIAKLVKGTKGGRP
jgi:thiol-disulfide isomerase/thioredoxin